MYSRFLINQDRKFRSILMVFGFALILGLCYPIVSREFDRGFWPFGNGIAIALLCASFVVINELYFQNLRGSARLKFLPVVMLTTLKYVVAIGVIIALVLGVSYSLEDGIPVFEHITSEDYFDFLIYGDFRGIVFYASIGTFFIVFGRQLSKKLGSNILFSMISGRYHKPKSEERVFMNIDITGSTTIAERMTHTEYHSFIHDFIYDITGPIISTQGEIYRYIGDGAIITWPLSRGLSNSNCLRCIFLINHEIESRKEYYLNRYQIKPQFTIGMHLGEVLTGEIGYIKTQITFNGSVVFDTDKLEKGCKKFEVSNLISGDLLEKAALPSVFDSKEVGKIENGKGEELLCFTLEEKDVFYAP